MRLAQGLAPLVALLTVNTLGCSAGIDVARPDAPDPVESAVTEFVSNNPFRNRAPADAATAACIGARLVGRIGRERLAQVGLAGAEGTPSFFAGSMLWPGDIGAAFDRLVTGCTSEVEVRSAGATYARRLANPYFEPSFGEEFCLGEWLLTAGLDPQAAPLPVQARTITADGIEAVSVTVSAVGACLGLGRAVLAGQDPSTGLRPASVDCLLGGSTDADYRALIALTAPLTAPSPDEATAVLGYLGECMTGEELAAVVGLA